MSGAGYSSYSKARRWPAVCGEEARQTTRQFGLLLGLTLLTLCASFGASAQTGAPPQQTADAHTQICAVIEASARANGLPIDFFTRVIWQESRFQTDVIGPVTRSGERAEGIAQFMPTTAAKRSLQEPFDPMEALPKSGEYLAELRNQFGNLGLAAAAYNAGPQRLRDFIAGSRDLPAETRNYVLAITGRSVDEWAQAATKPSSTGAADEKRSAAAATSCHDLVSLLERTPNALAARWRNVPSWCRGLRHPDTGICGPVHLIETSDTTAIPPISKSHVHLFATSSR